MLSNKTRHTVHQDHAKSMDGAALLWLFLTARIFAVGALRQIYAHHNHFVMESCKPGLGHSKPANKISPAHHNHRMEAYISCAMAPESRVVHLMGAPTETRHLIVTNEIDALGPPWSIHAGVGIRSYRFIPAMANGNVDFTDMDLLYAEALL